MGTGNRNERALPRAVRGLGLRGRSLTQAGESCNASISGNYIFQFYFRLSVNFINFILFRLLSNMILVNIV